jgi:hypothetical protein
MSTRSRQPLIELVNPLLSRDREGAVPFATALVTYAN